MSKDNTSTRRSFLKSAALLAAPLAAAAPAAVWTDDALKARLARLEDEAAIGKLHQTWLRQVNAAGAGARKPVVTDLEGVRSLAPDHSSEPGTIVIAPDGKSATGRFPCAVELESAVPQDSTLGQMAHVQGSGFVCRTERRTLNAEYAKTSGSWSIANVQFASG